MTRLLAAALVAALAAPPALAQEPSLAEVARREKQRRKAAQKEAAPAATFTDEDLKADHGGGTVSSPAAAGVRGARPGAPPAAGTRDPDAAKKAWFQRAEALRKAIAAQEAAVPRLEQQIAGLRNDTAPNPADLLDPNRLQKREAEVARLRQEVEAAQAELQRLKAAYTELEDEARSQSIPPGWLEGRFSG